LINIAASVKAAMLEDADLDEWDGAFQANVRGALELARCVVHHRPGLRV